MKKLIIVFTLLAFTFCTAATLPFQAENDAVQALQDKQETLNVFVHISAAKARKDGKRVAKITRITLARKGQKPGKNMLRAKLRRENNLLQFEIQMLKKSVDGFLMPKGFVINDRISKMLGASKPVVMSGGSTMLKNPKNSLLQFEIQL